MSVNLGAVIRRELLEDALLGLEVAEHGSVDDGRALVGDADKHAAPVLWTASPGYEAARLEAVDALADDAESVEPDSSDENPATGGAGGASCASPPRSPVGLLGSGW